MLTLKEPELQKLLLETIDKIGGDTKYLPKINDSNDFAMPFIEIGRYGYEYVTRARGVEILRKLPIDTEELLYLVFCDVTFSMIFGSTFGKRSFAAIHTKEVAEEKVVELLNPVKLGFGERLAKDWGIRR
jgi:hypothetical protein